MVSLVRKLFNIRKGEGKPVAILFSFFFLIVAVSIAGKTARDTIFLNQYDKTYLPLMFVAIAVVVSIIIPIYTRLTKNAGKLTTVLVVNLLSSGVILFFYFSMHDIMIPVFYVIMEIIVILTGLQLWGLAGSVFNPMQAKRVFPLLSAGGSLAAIIVGFGISPVVARFGSKTLLLFTIGFLLTGIFICFLSKDFLTEDKQSSAYTRKKPGRQGFNSYIVSIAFVVGLSALVSTFVDYQFKISASTEFHSNELAGFFGNYYAITGVAGLLIQLFVVSRLLSILGVLAGLLILPVFLLFGSTGFLLVPGILSISAAKFSDQTFKFTVHSTATQLLWLPVPGPQKAKFKPVVTGSIKTILEGLAGITAFIAVRYMSIQQLSFISIALIISWIVVTFFLKSGYIRTLEDAIEKRELDFTELKIDATDKAMVDTLNRALLSGDKHQQHFALELMEGLNLTPWENTLKELMVSATVEIRNAIMDLAKDDASIIPDDDILSSIRNCSELVLPAITVAANRNIEKSNDLLKNLLSHERPEIRLGAARGLLSLSNNADVEARNLIESLLTSDNVEEQSSALEAVNGLAGFLPASRILEFLYNDSYRVRLAALDLCKDGKAEELIPGILNNIRSSKTAGRTRDVLWLYDEELVFKHTKKWIKESSLTAAEKGNLSVMLKFYPGREAIEILLDIWNHRQLSVCAAIADSLLTIARQEPIPPELITKIDKLARDLARGMYGDTKILLGLSSGDHSQLLSDYINRRLSQTIPVILKLGVLDLPETKIETYIQYIITDDKENMPFLFELLDTIFTKTERQALLPLISPMSRMERVKIGHRLFPSLSRLKMETQFLSLLKSSNSWESAITAFYILNEKGNEKLIPTVFKLALKNKFMLETVQYVVFKRKKEFKGLDIPEPFILKELPSMYSTLEKTLLLKSVPLFQSIPGKDLSRVAQIAEEVRYTSNENIFKEGEPGHSMYIIVDGEILIHRNVKKIATLKKGDCLGEMAILDQEPRSADATVNNEAILLKINQEGFYELMSGNLEIMRGILKLLTNRLRDAIA